MIEDAQMVKFYISLKPRQREAIELACEGLSNDEIAARLVIASNSVAEHLSNVYAEMRLLEALSERRTNRPLMISLFAPFFERHPEMRNDSLAVPPR